MRTYISNRNIIILTPKINRTEIQVQQNKNYNILPTCFCNFIINEITIFIHPIRLWPLCCLNLFWFCICGESLRNFTYNAFTFTSVCAFWLRSLCHFTLNCLPPSLSYFHHLLYIWSLVFPFDFSLMWFFLVSSLLFNVLSLPLISLHIPKPPNFWSFSMSYFTLSINNLLYFLILKSSVLLCG